MNRITLLAFLLIIPATYSAEKLPGKKVSIGPENFSEIYPAVWFCPDDASISPLIEKSETPPEAKYRIWIEPNDPEMNVVPFEGLIKAKPFMKIGNGVEAFKNVKLGSTGEEFRKLGQSEITDKKPVFIYREQKKQWVFMVLAFDKKKQTISFIWKELQE